MRLRTNVKEGKEEKKRLKLIAIWRRLTARWKAGKQSARPCRRDGKCKEHTDRNGRKEEGRERKKKIVRLLCSDTQCSVLNEMHAVRPRERKKLYNTQKTEREKTKKISIYLFWKQRNPINFTFSLFLSSSPDGFCVRCAAFFIFLFLSLLPYLGSILEFQIAYLCCYM